MISQEVGDGDPVRIRKKRNGKARDETKYYIKNGIGGKIKRKDRINNKREEKEEILFTNIASWPASY
jgi:hypothetical protein